MSQATLTHRPYVNSNLFSSHYLDERLQARSEWDCDDEAKHALKALQDLYELEGPVLSTYNEDTLIDNWIDEVLEIFGYGTQQQVALPGERGFVDELLFETSTVRREAATTYLRTQDTTELFRGGIGIVEAKQWDAAFDDRFSDQRPYRNASHQIKHYLENTPSNIQWGILTNGRKWRLYGTKDYETQTYYEVDLPDLLENGDLEAFKYFYVFFRPAAYRGTGGTTFLEEVWSESETASQELGESLQDNVFTALRVLGRGFVETNDDLDIAPDDEEALHELKEQSLVFLYRLMFILYAEARGLIHPESQSAQDEYDQNFSFNELRLDIHGTIGEIDEGFEHEFSDYSTTMWSRLEDLFRLIDQGEANLGIPAYNGGLFDNEENAFLIDHEVSNQYLAEVIYRLSTTQNSEGRYVLADYADLDTRHLGSLYEGLLEHKFRIAPERYAAVAEDGGQIWKPVTESDILDAVEIVPEGGLYVVNDDGERKASGSYYTPDYVVTYMIEETVKPLIEEIRQNLINQGFEPGTQEYIGPFFERVTDLRILDPAMGSGHFLTKATGYLSEQVMAEIREVEEDFMWSFDEQHIRREIAKECIYGVDKNGMAVELAKLSMWLETLAADRPLAFLNHHLKQGNSLVGSSMENLGKLESDTTGDNSQYSLAEFGGIREGTIERLMDIYNEFLSTENKTVEDVREIKKKYAEIEQDELRSRLVAVANVRTAEDFGLDLSAGSYRDPFKWMASAIESDEEWIIVQEQDWFRSAQALAEEHEFFHWELEFPEVFYDQDGTASDTSGFHCCLGNPPYVSSRNVNFGNPLTEFYETTFDLALYQIDLYYLFMELATNITNHNGRWSYIIPDTWLGSVKTSTVRSWIATNNHIHDITLPENRVFSAQVDCLIIISSPSDKNISTQSSVTSLSELDSKRKRRVTLPNDGREFVVSSGGLILKRIEDQSVPLGDISKTGRGIGAYHHSHHSKEMIENRIFHAKKQIDDTYRPELGGENVKRYSVAWEGNRWISYGDWLAEPREADLFEGPRLLCRKIISDRLCCTYTDDLQLVDQQVYVAAQFDDSYSARYATGLIASTLLGFYARTRFNEDTELFPHIRVSQFRELPIRVIEEKSNLNQSKAKKVRKLIKKTKPYSGDGAERDITNPREVIEILVEIIIGLKSSANNLNLHLPDYITSYSNGPTLAELSSPPSGLSQTLLTKSEGDTDRYEKLRIDSVEIDRESDNLSLSVVPYVKPVEELRDEYETNSHGYTTLDAIPAMNFRGLCREEADLIQSFVPYAVDEAGGFAGFRDNATATITPLDRLESLTLPALDDVRDGLADYREAVADNEELEEKIERTDDLIDEIVYDLYGLTDEEIKIIEDGIITN